MQGFSAAVVTGTSLDNTGNSANSPQLVAYMTGVDSEGSAVWGPEEPV